MNKSLPVVLVTAVALLLAGCGASEPASITASGEDPSVRLEVECEDGGVTAVSTTYGGAGSEFSTLVGGDGGVKSLGGVESLSKSYGGMSHVREDRADLKVFVAPVEGTCIVQLTADPGGETLVHETKKDKDFKLEATVIRE